MFIQKAVWHLGLEEADGVAVVLEAVDPQVAAAGWRQRLLGDELQQTNEGDSGLQIHVNILQLNVVLQEVKSAQFK